jgi:RNA polymerase sigma-70 factor (ECF subfamily)
MALPDESDQTCAERAQRGDQAAYGEPVRRYQARLYRFVLRMVGSPDEALELAQDAFVRTWQALPDWRPDAKFHTWLFRIASNAALDSLRRRKIVEFVPIEESYEAESAEPDPARRLEIAQAVRGLETVLRELPAEQREIVLLREVEDMSYEEIGAVLGIAEGTVKSRLARGAGRACRNGRCSRRCAAPPRRSGWARVQAVSS